jgi:acyl-CoA thioester hydrolase
VIRVEDGRLLCEGSTSHVVVGRDMVKRPLPEQYERAFRTLLSRDSPADPAIEDAAAGEGTL